VSSLSSPLLRLLPLFRPQLGWVVVGVLGSFVSAGARVAAPLFVASALDGAIPQGDLAGLLSATLAFLAFLVLDFVSAFGSRTALEVATQRALLELRSGLFLHLAGHDVAFHDRTPAGSLVGRVQGDSEALRVLFVEVLFALPAELLMLAGMVVVLVARAPGVAMPIVVVLPVYALWFWLFRRVAPPYFTEQRKAMSRLTGLVAETVRNAAWLQALGRHEWTLARTVVRVNETRRTEVLGHLQPIWYYNGALAIRAVAVVALLLTGAREIAAGAATVGVVVVGLSYLRQLFAPLMRLSNQLGMLERARAAAVRIAELQDERPTIVDAPGAVPWPGLSREVRFQGVTFAYDTPSAGAGRPVFSDFDLTIPAGTRLGLVGSTGSGKSTLVDLLLRFRDPVAGQVTVYGVPVNQIQLAGLRKRTALVLQDVRLLRGTVLENLGGDRDAARRALDRLAIDVDLDTLLEDGVSSRGERQLLTLARALVADPELLVLDEATSAVDPATEARLQRALDELLVGRTVVIVAHRLDTVRRCDAIVVLEQGRVVEMGSHEDLLSRGGRYAALVATQRGVAA
jgi:ABC-type multidrug transport system fused ATPase/permease subunit